MELNPHDWHKRPSGCGTLEPCPVCGCPAAGTRKAGTWHRATLETENLPFPFIGRKKSAKGWQQLGIQLPRPAAAPAHRKAPGKDRAQPEATFTAASAPVEVTSVKLTGSAATDPGVTTLNLMARAAVLHVMGKGFPAIEESMKLKARTIATWKNHFPEQWEMACHSAESQLLTMVKAQIGTTAVLEDVDGYLQRAEVADRSGAIVPKPAKPTLCTFFASYFLPTCLYEAKPTTVYHYQNALKLWRLITGDPPLEAITTDTLTLFRNALAKRSGKSSCQKAARNTVGARLKTIQTILDKAGPPARRNRDAKGLLAVVPWIRPPRLETKLPRLISSEMLKVVYDATAGMDWPDVPGVKAPAWWKALLEVAYNTQLRRRTLFEMRMQEIDWGKNRLVLSGDRFKSGQPMLVHLNPAAVEALRGIRTARELVFPFPGWEKDFHRWFHRLQDSAGIPKKEHFGLHVIRKTAATVLAGFAPNIAQLALGHSSLSTTLNYYVDPAPIIGPSLDAMPQPFGVTTP